MGACQAVTPPRAGRPDLLRPALGNTTKGTPVDRETYARWHDHPLRSLLRRAAAGDRIYDDEIDDLRLPPRVKSAAKQAMAKVAAEQPKQMHVDHLSGELVAALPDGHETRQQYEERRANAGDAEALANVKAREEATNRMVDKILENKGMR